MTDKKCDGALQKLAEITAQLRGAEALLELEPVEAGPEHDLARAQLLTLLSATVANIDLLAGCLDELAAPVVH